MTDTPPTPICVLKLGGEVVASREDGWRFVICHGGGPQTSALSQRLGLEVNKVAGQRVTDEATLRVTCQAIAGEVGSAVVAAAWGLGLAALGLSAGVVHGRRRPPVAIESEAGRIVDYGLVGDVTRVERGAIEACWAAGLTPVLSSIGVAEDASGQLYDIINADTVAAAVALALGVDHLFSVTVVGGVLRDRDDPSSRIARLSAPEARAAIAEGTIVGGMIPKVEEALAALEGARSVHVLAPEAGALAEEARAPGSRGTVLTAQRPATDSAVTC